jgi:hypothetical protein
MANVLILGANGQLARNTTPQAQRIVEAMHTTGLRRLIFISSMGIYSEVPGERRSEVTTCR